MSNNIEIWKPVVGYEGLYEVSSFGRIKNIKRNKILSLGMDKDGYKLCALYSFNTRRMKKVHRLVAQAFPEICGEWFEGCVIDHINTLCDDNRATNLKVCTHKENCSNPLTMQHRKLNPPKPWIGRAGKDHIRSKPVLQYDIHQNLIKEWGSTREAGRELQLCCSTISACCRGKGKTCGGYIWKYKRTA